MNIVNELKSLYEITKPFIQQPRLSFKLLARLPATLRGFNYAQKWQPFNADNAAPSLSGPPTAPGPSNPLKSYFDRHKEGKGILKWAHYFDIYHRHFNKFVGKEVHILEVGVYGGGSLEMWKDYFGPKCHIYGVDIKEECRVYKNEYTDIFVGDQADRKFWKRFKDKVPLVDILIDDGGHQAEQQIVTLEEMLPHISAGGVYLCEDIHRAHNDFTSYLHGLVKNLNNAAQLSEFVIRPTKFQSCVGSIHFYPHVAVIEKTERPEEEFVALKHGTEWQPFLS
jgi:hypothetical protein